MAVKAAHIEIVSNLSTNNFLEELKRMITRRRPVSHIYCDNTTNFVGGANKLFEWKKFILYPST